MFKSGMLATSTAAAQQLYLALAWQFMCRLSLPAALQYVVAANESSYICCCLAGPAESAETLAGDGTSGEPRHCRL